MRRILLSERLRGWGLKEEQIRKVQALVQGSYRRRKRS